jgi:hypothetical protein
MAEEAQELVVVAGDYRGVFYACDCDSREASEKRGAARRECVAEILGDAVDEFVESMAILLLPLGLILATGLVAQIEFKNNAWKQVLTAPQTLTSIYFAKLAVMVMIVELLLLFNVGVYLSGVVPCLLTKGVPLPPEPVPYLFFLREDLRYFTDCLPILGLEHLVSLQFSNFLVPVGGGVAAWILSLAVLNWKYGYLFPYTYCGLYYFRVVGRYTQSTPIHLWALGYFAVFVVAEYVLFLTKKQKG